MDIKIKKKDGTETGFTVKGGQALENQDFLKENIEKGEIFSEGAMKECTRGILKYRIADPSGKEFPLEYDLIQGSPLEEEDKWGLKIVKVGISMETLSANGVLESLLEPFWEYHASGVEPQVLENGGKVNEYLDLNIDETSDNSTEISFSSKKNTKTDVEGIWDLITKNFGIPDEETYMGQYGESELVNKYTAIRRQDGTEYIYSLIKEDDYMLDSYLQETMGKLPEEIRKHESEILQYFLEDKVPMGELPFTMEKIVPEGEEGYRKYHIRTVSR